MCGIIPFSHSACIRFASEHPATLNNRRAAIARNDLALTFTAVAEFSEPIAEDVLKPSGQRCPDACGPFEIAQAALAHRRANRRSAP
jgi:hypothetical protein